MNAPRTLTLISSYIGSNAQRKGKYQDGFEKQGRLELRLRIKDQGAYIVGVELEILCKTRDANDETSDTATWSTEVEES
jgi:hypothetical protein